MYESWLHLGSLHTVATQLLMYIIILKPEVVQLVSVQYKHDNDGD